MADGVAPPLTVPAALARLVEVCPDRDAVVTLNERVTWAELDVASRDVAARLVGLGVRRRTRVGLLMPNGPAWAVVAFGVLRTGAVLVPLSTLLRPPELERQLRAAEVEQLLLIEHFRGRDYTSELAALRPTSGPVERFPSLRAVHTWQQLEQMVPSAADREIACALEDRARPADDLAVIFTSGSSGAPKGVVHTHGSALRAVAAGLEVRCVQPGERLYLPMPLFWTGGFAGGLLTVLLGQATLLTEAAPSPEETLQLLEREKATLFRGWPDQAEALAAHPAAETTDLSSLRPGSLQALLPADQRSAPGARASLFGMTETCGPYCGDRLDTDMPPEARGSCGTPLSGIELRIDAAAVGEVGEIWLRGPHLLRGICGLPREEVFTVDGWYRTGDLGRLDEMGRLWFAGRVDDMLKVRGATVYPSEVEEALLAVPGVVRAFVTGLVDAAGVCIVGAAVVPATGTALDAGQLRHELRRQLSAYKVPTVLRVLAAGSDVKRTPTGKVDRAALERLLGA